MAGSLSSEQRDRQTKLDEDHDEKEMTRSSVAATKARRKAQHTIQRRAPFKTALYMVGLLMILFSATMLPPITVAWWYDGYKVVMPFAETLGATLGFGLLCWLPVCRLKADLRNRDGFVVVVAFWVLLSLLGAIPFVLAEHPHMRLVDAVFETASGLTTTGATILTGLDALPKAILYYRAQLNLLGGMGVVVLAVALLPMLGVGGMQLYKAETPGPMKDEKLTPRITETAKNLWVIYFGLNMACALSFWAAGMSPFDAVCHSFSTLALGGFSTHDDSIGYFHSLPIELISGIFTLIAAVNFALYFMALRTGSLRVVFRDAEFRFFLAVIGGIVALTCCISLFQRHIFAVGGASPRLFPEPVHRNQQRPYDSQLFGLAVFHSFAAAARQLFRRLRGIDLRRH